MATPLLSCKFDLDARAFALEDRATESLDQRFNVCKHDGRQRGLGEDRGERLAMATIHGSMIAQSAITARLAVKLRSL